MRYIPHIFTHRSVWQLGALCIADGIVFGGTSASSVASPMLITGFLLLAATAYQLLRVLITLASLYGLQVKRSRRLAVSLTGLASGLVALQSIGELSSRDALVLLPLAIIGYLYSQARLRGTL